jgi:hypothetical protein
VIHLTTSQITEEGEKTMPLNKRPPETIERRIRFDEPSQTPAPPVGAAATTDRSKAS